MYSLEMCHIVNKFFFDFKDSDGLVIDGIYSGAAVKYDKMSSLL